MMGAKRGTLMKFEYSVVRSSRRTVSMEVTPELNIIVRAPHRMSASAIERFASEHEEWAAAHIEKMRLRIQNHPEPDTETKERLRSEAKKVIPELVAKYARIMGVSPAGIKITDAGKRFGSCSGRNSLCFSLRLMSYPAEAVEYVVVHELAHIRYKNHSRDFYAYIERFMPDFREREKLLRS